MRILYAAKHNKGANDNEGAIAHALAMLGHQVFPVHEDTLRDQWPSLRHAHSPDLLLFQNWRNPPALDDVNYPKAFWYMDRIDYRGDDILAHWTAHRRQWMSYVVPRVNVGFCTDGDWVAQDRTGRLKHLMQGADERHLAQPTAPGTKHKVLFCGSVYGRGEGRESFVRELQATYGKDFRWEQKCFGQRLRNAVQSAQIVVAPDGPIGPLYTSNRAVITCSLGGFLLHPRCHIMESMYRDGHEAVFYSSRQDLHDKINHYAARPDERFAIQLAGYHRTIRQHLYRHKLDTILSEVKARCGITDPLD